jgi:hypothetical protein
VKIKNTIILLGVFIVLLLFILFLDKKAPADKASGPEEKLVTLAPADIQKVTFKKETETLTFNKDDKGDWMMLEPLEAKADNTEVGQLVDGFADLKIERVVEKESSDLKKYQIPLKEISLWVKGQDNPVKILIGQENPLGNTFYAQKDGDKRIVLLPSTLKTALDKKLFDFRQKDIFKYETADVAAIRLQSKEASWEAVKKDGEWFFQKPFKALAKESKITDLLGSLSNQRAKEFVAEAKKAEDVKKAGLDKPEYQVTLSLPKDNKELGFAFHKADDKTYVTTSQSTKIIVPEIEMLADLDKKPADLRENKIVVFNTWQASKVGLKKGGLSLMLTKASNDKWYFDAAQKEEADASKIDTFVRKIESLEAAEYVDAPKGLAEYGLEKPQAEVTIWTKESGEKPVEKSFTVLIGKEDKDKKQAVVKNARFDYLFRVDSAFLTEFPKEAKDWKAPVPEKKEPEKK